MAKKVQKHHTEIIADLCEMLETWFNNLSDKDKLNLGDEDIADMQAGQIMRHPQQFGVHKILETMSNDFGSSCKRSFLREALRQLRSEHLEALAKQKQLAGVR